MARKIEVFIKRDQDHATGFTFEPAEVWVKDGLLYVTQPQIGVEQFFPLDNVLLCKMTDITEIVTEAE